MLLTFTTQITPLMRQAKAVGPKKKSNYYVPAKEGKGAARSLGTVHPINEMITTVQQK